MGADAIRALGKAAHVLYDLKYVLDAKEADISTLLSAINESRE